MHPVISVQQFEKGPDPSTDPWKRDHPRPPRVEDDDIYLADIIAERNTKSGRKKCHARWIGYSLEQVQWLGEGDVTDELVRDFVTPGLISIAYEDFPTGDTIFIKVPRRGRLHHQDTHNRRPWLCFCYTAWGLGSGGGGGQAAEGSGAGVGTVVDSHCVLARVCVCVSCMGELPISPLGIPTSARPGLFLTSITYTSMHSS